VDGAVSLTESGVCRLLRKPYAEAALLAALDQEMEQGATPAKSP
jgi:hypothetical protein